jgi:hypothetical protein
MFIYNSYPTTILLSPMNSIVFDQPGTHNLKPIDYCYSPEIIVEVRGAGGGGNCPDTYLSVYGGGGGAYARGFLYTEQRDFIIHVGPGGLGGVRASNLNDPSLSETDRMRILADPDKSYQGTDGQLSYIASNDGLTNLGAQGGLGTGTGATTTTATGDVIISQEAKGQASTPTFSFDLFKELGVIWGQGGSGAMGGAGGRYNGLVSAYGPVNGQTPGGGGSGFYPSAKPLSNTPTSSIPTKTWHKAGDGGHGSVTIYFTTAYDEIPHNSFINDNKADRERPRNQSDRFSPPRTNQSSRTNQSGKE